MAALAAATAALALAVPASSAGAATPLVRTAGPLGAHGLLQPGSPSCQGLINQVRFLYGIRSIPLGDVYSTAFVYSGCGGAAI